MPTIEQVWGETVLRWPGLRGEPKLAWLYLARSGALEALVTVTAADVAAWQGTTAAAGRRYLQTLEQLDLVEIAHRDERTGAIDLWLPDPYEVRRGLRAVKWDGQRELFTTETETDHDENHDEPARAPLELALLPVSSPDRLQDNKRGDRTSGGHLLGTPAVAEHAAGPQPRPDLPPGRGGSGAGSAHTAAEVEPVPEPDLHAPRALAPSVPSELQSFKLCSSSSATLGSSPPPSPPKDPEVTHRHNRRAAAEVEPQPPRDREREHQAVPIGGLLGGMVEQVLQTTPEQQAQRVEVQRERAERLAADLRRRVKDDNLRQTPCLRLAWAVVEGHVREQDAWAIVARIDELRKAGELRCAFGYFAKAANNLLDRAQLGPSWEEHYRRELGRGE